MARARRLGGRLPDPAGFIGEIEVEVLQHRELLEVLELGLLGDAGAHDRRRRLVHLAEQAADGGLDLAELHLGGGLEQLGIVAADGAQQGLAGARLVVVRGNLDAVDVGDDDGDFRTGSAGGGRMGHVQFPRVWCAA